MIWNYGSNVVAACEAVWEGIRVNHTDLPDVIFTVGDGRGKIWGYFNHGSWTEDGKGKVLQVMIAGERLEYGAEGVLSTVLHEAVHALAHVRDIKDTSRQGRYHNKKFQALAVAIGLKCEHLDDTHGLSKTSLTEESTKAYAPQLHELQQVLKFYKRAPVPVAAAPKAPKAPPAECECGRKIPSTYLPVICGDCRTDFQEAE